MAGGARVKLDDALLPGIVDLALPCGVQPPLYAVHTSVCSNRDL